MLPFRKSDSPFKSDPVSRVGSSTRLNQLGGPTSSNPATPQPYVTSSLNPSKNLPTNATNIKSKLQTQKDLDVFEQLPMVRQVKNYESLLDELSNDIAQFKDDELQLKIDQIIVCNDTLKKQIEDLNKHRNYSHQVDELSAKNKALENSSKTILKQLVNYRNELKKLPKIPKSDKQLNQNSVDVDDVLKYAFKLAKFTKAPATVANMPFQIHPNNYIWPAEDSLRRGMLAQASLQPDQIIKEEEEESEQKPESDEEMEDVINTTTHDEPQQQQRKSSHDGGFTTERKPEEPSAPTDLNLDLFDPDDEYSD
ncbi:MED4 Mediator of RNA polymerase II transcription subunit 4 [Candida maltosa Xu316]